MSSILFGNNISLLTAATPSSGFLVAYDNDGILKQKDSSGLITPIGGGPTAGFSSTFSFAQTLSISNDSVTYSVIMGTATSILMGSASSISSLNGLSELYLDYLSVTSSVFLTNGYNYLSIDNGTVSIVNTLENDVLISNDKNYLLLATFSELYSDDEIRLKIFNYADEILLKKNIGASVSSANGNSNAVFIGSRNSTFASNVVNSVILGGIGQYASKDNSVYIPDTYIQDTKKLRGTLGDASLKFTGTNDLILSNSNSLISLISSSSSETLTKNGIIVSDTITDVYSPNVYSSPVFISTKNATILEGVHNSVIIGGENLINSLTNSVVLGEYVNINNAYTLPITDGTSNQVLKTDGLGNISWSDSSISTTNGIKQISSGIYGLGGSFSQNTTIDGQSTYSLSLINLESELIRTSGPNDYSEFYISDSYGSLVTYIGGYTYSSLFTNNNEVKLESFDGSLINYLKITNVSQTINDFSNDNYMIVKDNIGLKGLVYYDDYSSNFTTYSLVTKKYVDTAVDAIGGTNGLSELSNGIIGLGGTLSQTTTIELSTFDFTINTSASELELNRISTTYPGVTNTFKLEDKYAIVKSESMYYNSNVELYNEDNGQVGIVIKSDLGTYSNLIHISDSYIRSLISSVDGSGSASGVMISNLPQSITSGDSSTNNNLIIVDQLSNKGLVYDEDYSPNFTDNSLVTKSWVNSNTTGKYSITRGFTASLTQTITHGLGTDEIIVQTYDSTGIQVIPGTVQINGLNSVDITFSKTISSIKIVVIG